MPPAVARLVAEVPLEGQASRRLVHLSPVADVLAEVGTLPGGSAGPAEAFLRLLDYKGRVLQRRDIPGDVVLARFAPQHASPRFVLTLGSREPEHVQPAPHAPDPTRLLLAHQSPGEPEHVLRVCTLADPGDRNAADVTVVGTGRVHDAAWLNLQEVLVVGIGKLIGEHLQEAEPWVRVVGVDGQVNQLPVDAIPGPVKRMMCGANGVVAAVPSVQLGGEVQISLLQAFRTPTLSTKQLGAAKINWLRQPLLTADGKHFLSGFVTEDWTAIAIPEVGPEANLGKGWRAAGLGQCLVVFDKKSVRAWRSGPVGVVPWGQWRTESDTSSAAQLDVAVRDDTADVAVIDHDRIRVYRLTDPDMLDLWSEDAGRRHQATRVVAGRRNVDVVPRLIQLLSSGHPNDRSAAGTGLVTIGTTNALDGVVGALGYQIGDSGADPLLGVLSAVPAEDLLAAVLRCLSKGRVARQGAVRALVDRAELEATDELCDALRDPDQQVRASAAEALRSRATLRAVPALLGALADGETAVASAALEALEETLLQHALLTEEVAALLGDLEASTEAYVAHVLHTGRTSGAGKREAEGKRLLTALATALVDPAHPLDELLNGLQVFAGRAEHRRPGLVLGLVTADLLRGAGRDKDAASVLQQAADSASNLDTPAVVWRTRATLGELAESSGDDRAAALHFTNAMGTIDTLWAALLGDPEDVHFFTDKADLYERAMLCQLRLGHPSLALETLEKAKIRYLGDLIARRHNPRRKTLEPIDEQFWRFAGVRRPVSFVTSDSAYEPQWESEIVGVQTTAVGGQWRAPIPERFAALINATAEEQQPHWSMQIVKDVWLVTAAVQGQDAPPGAEESVRNALGKVHAALAAARDATDDGAKPADLVHRGTVVARYLDAARALDDSRPGYYGYGLWEYKSNWLERYLDTPSGVEALALAAVQEAAGYLSGREPVLADPSWAERPRSVAEEPAAQRAITPDELRPLFTVRTLGQPDSDGAHTTATSAFAAATEIRWQYITRLARGETAGFRRAAASLAHDPGTALLQFALTRFGTVAFVAARGAELDGAPVPKLAGWHGPAVFTNGAVTTQSLGERLIGHQASWMDRYRRREEDLAEWCEATDDLLCWLYAELFAPVRSWLLERGVRRLLVIPHRGLHQVPLPAWYGKAGRSGRRFVVDEFDVCFAPSLTLHDICQERSAGRTDPVTDVLAVTDPTGDLKFTRVEVLALAGTMGVHPQVLPGPEARTDRWQAAAAGADLCHYAGHGAYDWTNPLNSLLLLADGPLTLGVIFDEAFALPRVQAVGLSGCETTMTDPRDLADEYLGIASGFVFAGTPAVLSTLWEVEEVASALLVSRFYRELSRGRRPSAALAHAQRWLRDNVRHRDVVRLLDRALHELPNQDWLDDETRDTLQDDLRQERMSRIADRRRHPLERPYRHPVFWAGYTVAGVDRVLGLVPPTAKQR
jgi:CHAT domain-containing protein/HEAT repeat protein